jgi:hypothetical protein
MSVLPVARSVGNHRLTASCTISSRCAAGEPGRVFAEAQRGKLQALDRGEVREDRLSEFPRGHTVLDGERGSLDRIAAFGRQDMRAEQPVRRAISDQLDQAPNRVNRRKSEELWHGRASDRVR